MLTENLVKVWALHTPTPFFLRGLLVATNNHKREQAHIYCKEIKKTLPCTSGLLYCIKYMYR